MRYYSAKEKGRPTSRPRFEMAKPPNSGDIAANGNIHLWEDRRNLGVSCVNMVHCCFELHPRLDIRSPLCGSDSRYGERG